MSKRNLFILAILLVVFSLSTGTIFGSVVDARIGVAAPEEPTGDDQNGEEESVTTPEPTAEPTEESVEEPVTEEVVEEPVTEEPTEEPVTEEPVTEEPVTEEPTEEPVTEEPTEEPVTEEPTEEPVTEEPTEEPVTEEPTEEPATEEPVVQMQPQSVVAPNYIENWDGRGSDSLQCGKLGDGPRTEAGWIHWIFSTKGNSTDAKLTLGGTGSGAYQPSEPLNAEVWHFFTPYFDPQGLSASIKLFGVSQAPNGGGLVISDYCPGVVVTEEPTPIETEEPTPVVTEEPAPPAGSITVIKNVVNADEDDENPETFSFVFTTSRSAGTSALPFELVHRNSQSFRNLEPVHAQTDVTVYSVVERYKDGWENLTAADVSCQTTEGSTINFADNPSTQVAGVVIFLRPGDDVTCTFNNTEVIPEPTPDPTEEPTPVVTAEPTPDPTGTITVIKNVVYEGSFADVVKGQSFEISLSGTNGFSLSDGESYGPVTLPANQTYYMSENLHSGMFGSWSASTECVVGDSVIVTGETSVNVPLGDDEDVVCTITNTLVGTGQLTLVKVLGDDTEAIEGEWEFTLGASYTNLNLSVKLPGAGGSTTLTLPTGYEYSVSEIVPEGYELDSVVCEQNGNVVLPEYIGLSLGAVTCTFTNVQDPPVIEEPTPVVTEEPTPVETEEPTPVVTEEPTPIVTNPDLSISKSVVGNDTVPAGEYVYFNIVVSNNGDGVAENVVLVDPVPAYLRFSEVSGACGSFPCDLGNMDPGASATISIKARVLDAPPAPIVNTATASADNNGDVSDSAQVNGICEGGERFLMHVVGWINVNGSIANAVVRNNSDHCIFDIGMASYEKYEEHIPGYFDDLASQVLFDYVDGVPSLPGTDTPLQVNLPECAAQIDVFYGRVIYNLSAENRYGPRLLAWLHVGDDLCVVPEPQRISPVLECIADDGDGGFTALFGYNNPNGSTVNIPVGDNNRFNPAPQDRGQTTEFAPGRNVAVFSVPMTAGQTLVWNLTGSTSTASVGPNGEIHPSNKCKPPIQPVLECQSIDDGMVTFAWSTLPFDYDQDINVNWGGGYSHINPAPNEAVPSVFSPSGSNGTISYAFDGTDFAVTFTIVTPYNLSDPRMAVANTTSCERETPTPPPTETPPTDVPPTETPPTDVPPTETPPTDVPPTDVPPTDVPPTDVPPTDGPTPTPQLVTILPLLGAPRVSVGQCPDWIVYQSNQTGFWEVYRLGELPNGEQADVNLSQGGEADSIQPNRAPNYRWVTFTSNRDQQWEIYIAAVDNSVIRRMTFDGQNYMPKWSPQDDYVVYEHGDGNRDLRLIDLTNGNIIPLISWESNETNPSWHPDGDRVLFESDLTGVPQIYEVNIFTLEVRLVSQDPNVADRQPAYSPDGTKIAFVSYRDGDNSTVYVMNANGSGIQRVSDPAGNAFRPIWDDASDLIAYESTLTGEVEVYVYQLSSSLIRQLTEGGTNFSPTWMCESPTIVWTSNISGNHDLYMSNALPITAPPLRMELNEASQLTDDPGQDEFPAS